MYVWLKRDGQGRNWKELKKLFRKQINSRKEEMLEVYEAHSSYSIKKVKVSPEQYTVVRKKRQRRRRRRRRTSIPSMKDNELPKDNGPF